MSYSGISGLELFQMPFSSNHISRQQHPAAAQDKALQQSGRQTAVQQPVTQKPSENAAKPTAQAAKPAVYTVKKTDITLKNAAENGCAEPESETKASDQAQDEKTQADVPEKQPSMETAQKAQAVTEMTKSPDCTEQPEKQKKELVLDMSSGSAALCNDKAQTADDTEKRKAREAEEAKRKKEWEAKQLAKKQAEAAAIQKLQSMSDDEAVAASTRRISTDVEKLTRRNMKECAAEHIQGLCRKDPAFARRTMHPHKSMVNCFKYINRMAKEFILREMEDNGIKQDNDGYGCDVPDGIVYQWAEDYFNAADLPEDEQKEEKYVPKPYAGAASKAKKSASKAKKPAKKKEEKRSEPSGDYEQMSFV